MESTEGLYESTAPSTQRMRGRRGWARRYQTRLALSDAFVVTLVMVIAHGVRFGWEPLMPVSGAGAPAYVFVTVVIATLWVLLLGHLKSREPAILGHGPQEFQRVVQASWLTFASVAIIGFLTQWQISRGYLLFAIPIGTVSLLAYRAAWRFFLHAQRDAGELKAQCLVVGPPDTARQMVRHLHAVPRAGYAVVGICITGDAHASAVEGVPVLGRAEDTVSTAAAADAEYVILAGADALSPSATKALGWELEGTGIGLIVAPSIVDVAGPRVSLSPVDGLPLIHVGEARFTGGKYRLKSLMDGVAALVGLAVMAIPMLLVVLAIRLDSKGPAIFRQQRVGMDHQVFTMYKFRSMYVDADERLRPVATVGAGDAGNEVLFKMKADPRVTRVGRVLRRLSIDEMPQLVNVLKGDMSIVGPRPPLQSEVEQWGDGVERRQLVKPGLTGLWQVSGRSDLGWEQSVRLDVFYAENWSIAGDLVIVCRTAWAVLVGRGAY